MIQRLRVLKHYFGILVDDGALDHEINLTKTEWDILEEIEEVLEPFTLVQRVLEGKKICDTIIRCLPYQYNQEECANRDPMR